MASLKKRAKEFETPYPVTKAITKGDALTKLSMLVMGLGNLAHKQIVKGILFLAVEIAYLLFRDRRPYVRCRQQQIKCHTDKPRQNICCKEPPDKFFLSACGNQIIYNPDQITAKINHDRPRDHRDLLVQHRFYIVMFPRTGKRPRSKISDKIRCQRQN